MRILSLSLFTFLCLVNYAYERPDSLPVFKSKYEVCYKAKAEKDDYTLLEREWYIDYMSDDYYEYDHEGNLKRMMHFDKKDNLKSMTIFHNHANGETERMESYKMSEGDTVLNYYVLYFYDKNDELYKSESYTEEMVLEDITDFVDDTVKNTTAYYSYNPVSGDTTSFWYSELNEKELSIYEKDLDYKGDITEFWFDYEYNEYGDWIKQFIYIKEDELAYVVERELTYWEE